MGQVCQASTRQELPKKDIQEQGAIRIEKHTVLSFLPTWWAPWKEPLGLCSWVMFYSYSAYDMTAGIVCSKVFTKILPFNPH